MNSSPPLATAIPVAVYRRVSTDHQDNSLELQEKRVLDYLNYKWPGINTPNVFADPDTSGRTPMNERAGGADMIRRLSLGDVKHLVVAKIDRIGRNVRDALGFLEFCKEREITVHIVDFGGDSISTQGHTGKMILTMLLAFAEFEVGEIRERTTKVMRKKFDDGELAGHIPFGFSGEYVFADGHAERNVAAALAPGLLATLEAAHGSCHTKRLVPNEREQDIIRELVAWSKLTVYDEATGASRPASHRQIATWANDRGYTTKQGHPWGGGNVRSVLNNRYTARLLAQPPIPL